MTAAFAALASLLLAATSLAAPAQAASDAAKQETPPDPNAIIAPDLFKAMEYRNIGPFRGGRVTAVTGVRGERDTFYMGSTGGGVWKTGDGGETWKAVADEDLGAGSIGAVAVAPSDANVVYVGTGSACPRGNVSPGRGIWRSRDAGRSWQHVGLDEAGQIGRIRVDPTDPDRVYVAVLGHAFGPSKERGVYRSTDGGETWTKVLFVSDGAGAVDLALDPLNPRVLFAAIWQMQRTPWTMISGGDHSGLWRSTDAGESWEQLTDGLPDGPLGRIGVAVSGGRRGRVWALVEAEEGGLFRSDDDGKTFKRVSEDRELRQRAWYYTHVIADPRDGETVYVMNVAMWRSTDGGQHFDMVRVPHGDTHDLWIDPDDPAVMIHGSDGGAAVSYNGGRSWSTEENQPTAEFYRVTTDDRFPYRVFGCQQDNSCVAIASRNGGGGIGREEWYVIGGGESGWVAVDSRDPEVTFAGSYGGYITRFDHATHQNRNITAWPQVAVGLPARDLRFRFQWNAPIRISPHDPDTLYHCSQYVHRSRDGGQSWETISPDLTHDDESTQDYAGEPITRDNTGVEVYGTIFAFDESPQTPGLLWAGTDDGRVHLSRDAGATWTEITPKRMPERGQVNAIELSAHDPGRAFLAVTRYRFDDFRPFVFRTDDYGAHWTLLTDGDNGIPADYFVRVVREDPVRRGLLFAGTEFGVYVSFDDGRHWQSLRLKMPVTPVTDLAIRDDDLVVATQGRAFWILDDLTPLREMQPAIGDERVHLFTPHAFTDMAGGEGGPGGDAPDGVTIAYTLKEALEGDDAPELSIEILDGDGEVLRRMSSTEDERRAPNPFARFFPDRQRPRKLPVEAGMNRWVWDLRLTDADVVEDAVTWGTARGPLVPSGRYTARLMLGDTTATREFEVRADPRVEATEADLRARYELSREIWRAIGETYDAVRRIRDVREQATALAARIEAVGRGEGLVDEAKTLADELTALEERLHQYRAKSSQDILNYRQGLDGQLIGLRGVVESALAPPTDAAVERYRELRQRLDATLGELRGLIDGDLARFNEKVRALELPPVFPAKGV